MADLTVLGAGVAGLSAAYRAREASYSVDVFEAAKEPGGLLAGFSVEDFRFDRAVHLSFATEPEVREIFDRTPYRTHRPESLNWDNGHWLRHPAQNNMFSLDAKDKVTLIKGLADRPIKESISDYRDWLEQQYGVPIAERWPLRYTRKYWRMDASELGIDWVGSRMRSADIGEVLEGAFSDSDRNTYYIKEMRYPEEGGYFSFIEPLVEGLDIHFEHRAKSIRLTDRSIEFANGQTAKFDRLVSTLPLPQLARMIPEVPQGLKEASQELIATQIDLISVGFARADVPPSLWFYIYDEDIEAARAYSPSWKSPSNAPAGTSSLQFEIYSLPGEDIDRNPEYLIENTRYAIEKMGLASADEILFLHHTRLPFGNVVFKKGMETTRDSILEWLSEEGIESAGRFGEWGYLWSNQAFMSGRASAERLLGM